MHCIGILYNFAITVTSWWARWRLKSPASRLFTQPFIQTRIKENIKAPRHWPLCGELTRPVTGEVPAQGPVTRKMFPFDDVTMRHWDNIKRCDHQRKNVGIKVIGIDMVNTSFIIIRKWSGLFRLYAFCDIFVLTFSKMWRRSVGRAETTSPL